MLKYCRMPEPCKNCVFHAQYGILPNMSEAYRFPAAERHCVITLSRRLRIRPCENMPESGQFPAAERHCRKAVIQARISTIRLRRSDWLELLLFLCQMCATCDNVVFISSFARRVLEIQCRKHSNQHINLSLIHISEPTRPY